MTKELIIDLISVNVNELSKITADLEKNKKIEENFLGLTLSKIKNLYVQFKMLEDYCETNETKSYGDLAHEIEKNSKDESEELKEDIENEEKEDSVTYYEKINRMKEQDFLSVQLNYNPIKDIASAIALNDKIWFTKSLFDGDLKLFNATVSKINNLDYLEMALDYLEDNFSWSYEDPTVRKFYQYVYMRYA